MDRMKRGNRYKWTWYAEKEWDLGFIDGKGCKKKTRGGTKQDGNRNESRRIVIDRKIVDGKEGNLQV
jgi:hypothetical protein